MRLIDGDALESVYDDKCSLGEIGRRERDDVVNALRYCAPTVDAVPVVRCKECKWFGDYGCAIRIVDDTDKPSENDFCSFGERKGGDE